MNDCAESVFPSVERHRQHTPAVVVSGTQNSTAFFIVNPLACWMMLAARVCTWRWHADEKLLSIRPWSLMGMRRFRAILVCLLGTSPVTASSGFVVAQEWFPWLA